MVEPAQQNAVVGVGGPAPRMLLDMVDLAPVGPDMTAGDDAATVPNTDPATLVVREDPLQ